ncbi:MAG: BatD family protein [Phototrophicaceae bacterium]
MTGKQFMLVCISIFCMGITKVLGQGVDSPQGNLTATITNTTPYVGQEIVYKFIISDFINVETQPEYIKPSFENFWVNPDIGYVINDNYIVWETLLVPLQEGSIIIAPGQLRFGARADQASYQLQSNPIELFVQPLPEGAPTEFDGAVGEFDLRAAMNAQQISLGDYLELTITVGGTGNLQVIDPPDIAFPDEWGVVQGKPELIANQRIDTLYDPTRAGITEGTKKYNWYIQFPDVGTYSIPSVTFAYFNPSLRQYQMIGTQAIDVEVIPSLKPISPSQSMTTQLTMAGTFNWGKPIFLNQSFNYLVLLVVWGMAVVTCGIAVISQTKFILSSGIGKHSSPSIYNLARQKIGEYTQNHTDESIYGINRTLHAYLSQKLSIHTASLTLVEVQRLLIKSGVDERTSKILIEQLQLSDMWRFTPTATIDITQYGKQIAHLLSRIEQMIPK